MYISTHEYMSLIEQFLFFPLIVELTQNYLRLYLTHIADDSSDQTISETGRQLPKGLLIHCISGKRHLRMSNTGTFSCLYQVDAILTIRVSYLLLDRLGSHAAVYLIAQDIVMGGWRSSRVSDGCRDSLLDDGIRLVLIQVSHTSWLRFCFIFAI